VSAAGTVTFTSTCSTTTTNWNTNITSGQASGPGGANVTIVFLVGTLSGPTVDPCTNQTVSVGGGNIVFGLQNAAGGPQYVANLEVDRDIPQPPPFTAHQTANESGLLVRQ